MAEVKTFIAMIIILGFMMNFFSDDFTRGCFETITVMAVCMYGINVLLNGFGSFNYDIDIAYNKLEIYTEQVVSVQKKLFDDIASKEKGNETNKNLQ